MSLSRREEGLWPAAASCEPQPGDCPWLDHRHPHPPRLPAPSCPFPGPLLPPTALGSCRAPPCHQDQCPALFLDRSPEWNSPPREISLGTTQNPLDSPLGLRLGRGWTQRCPPGPEAPPPPPDLFGLEWEPGPRGATLLVGLMASLVRAGLGPGESCPPLPLTPDEREPQDRQGHGGLAGFGGGRTRASHHCSRPVTAKSKLLSPKSLAAHPGAPLYFRTWERP